jgi:hypothetical protein
MQCGSPALRDKTYCYFHLQWWENTEGVSVGAQQDRWHAAVTLLEDPNSVQMGLGEVMRMLVKRHIDYKTAALLLYGLQTASSNVRRTSFEPAEPRLVVIDHERVARCPIGATAWSMVEGREYDEIKHDESKNDEIGNGARKTESIEKEQVERKRDAKADGKAEEINTETLDLKIPDLKIGDLKDLDLRIDLRIEERLAELMRFTEGSRSDLDLLDRPVRGSRGEEGTEALKETLRLQFERQGQRAEDEAERISSNN